MKKILLLAMTMVLLVALVACGGETVEETVAPTVEPTVEPSTEPAPEPTEEPEEEPAEKTEIAMATLAGPTGMGMSYLGEMNELGEARNDYKITLSTDPSEVSAKFISGEIQIAAVPVNLASTIYTKTGNAKMLAINTLGVLHIVENGDTINSIEDLSGKTIQATGQGSTPEYILNYILAKNELTDSVTVEYLTEHSELTAQLAAGGSTMAMIPEPNASTAMSKNADLRLALDLTAEWDKVSETELVQGCVIVNADFLAENEEAVKNFMMDYEESVNFVNENHAEAAQLISKFGIIADAAVAEKAIPNCNIVFIAGDEMEASANAMFEVLFEANPQSIGGAIPDSEIYYK